MGDFQAQDPSIRWPALALRAALRPRSTIDAGPPGREQHLREAVEWIVTAIKHGQDGGIPAYFRVVGGRWTASYPETTGYTIPTLCRCGEALGDSRLNRLAVELARWLLTVRTPEKGLSTWDEPHGAPVVFDTGQGIFGWLAAWRATGDGIFLQAALDAGDWLVRVQSEAGPWTQNQYEDTPKAIDTRVAWALLLLGEFSGVSSYRDAARRNLDWTLAQQLPNGWFRHAAFRPGEEPSTHTLAYAAEGLMEGGLLLNEPTYVAAAEKAVRSLQRRQRDDGSLAWKYDSVWRATTRFSCLTGDCQAALLWLGLYGLTQDPALLSAARRAIVYVAGTQDLDSSDPGIRGGIAGSYPLYGGYARFRYPNWAAKFFIDALLALQRVESGLEAPQTWWG